MVFSGFPRGTRHTPVPDPVFGPLLESVEDTAELKCTLRAMWLLHRKRGHPRFLTARELLSDRVLLLGLKALGGDPEEAIRRGIGLAVKRGTLVQVSLDSGGGGKELYFLNDEAGRRGADLVAREGAGERIVVGEEPGSDVSVERDRIFSLYEDNIGLLTPLLADEMVEAEGAYPWPWIEEAFRIAVGRNVRKWDYIRAILKRWATEGKDDGESRRHSRQAPGSEELVEYLRQRGRLPGSRG